MNVDFEALYRSHHARVLGLCRRLLGAAQAEDATQEAFVRAYRAIGRYDPTQPFGPWVLGIAANFCIDALRRRANDSALFDASADAAAESAEDAPGAIDALVTAERASALRAAIDALPENYRAPLMLAYYAELSYDEIAESLGTTRNHVGVLLLRAKRYLRSTLAPLEEPDKP